MTDAFISYSRRDKDFVLRLHEVLQQDGRDIWVDWEDIPPSADWRQEIYAAIDSADALIFVLSPASVASEVCGEELEYAVKQNKKLIPIMYRDTDHAQVPAVLSALNWIFSRDDDDFDTAVRTLLGALDTDLERVRAHTRLLVSAREWEARPHHSLLLRSQALDDAERQFMGDAELEPRATPLQLSFLRASRTRATRRQGIVLSVVTFGMLVTGVLATVAWIQRQYSERRASAATIRNIAPSKPAVALATAVNEMDAWFANDVPEVRSSLLAALQTPKERTVYHPASARGTEASDRSGGPIGVPLAAVVATANGRIASAVDARLTSGPVTESITVWHVQGGASRAIPFGTPVLALSSCAEEPIAAVVTGDGSLHVVDLERETTTMSAKLRGPTGGSASSPRASAYSGGSAYGTERSAYGDGSAYASGGSAYAGRAAQADADTAYDARSPAAVAAGCTSVPHPPITVAMSADCKLVAVASERTVELWARSGSLQLIRQVSAGHPLSLAVSPTGRFVLHGYADGRIQRTYTTSRDDGDLFAVHASWCPVAALAVSADGQRVATADGRVIRLWQNLRDGAIEVGDGFHGHRDVVTSLAFDPVNNAFVVSGSRDNSVRTWALTGPTFGEPLRGHGSWVRSVAIAPDARSVYSASNDGSIRRWGVSAQLEALPCADQLAEADLVDITDDGRTMLVGLGPNLVTLTVADGDRCDVQIVTRARPVAAMSPHGRFIAYERTGELIVQNRSDVADVGLTGSTVDGLRALAVNDEGSLVAAAGRAGVIHLWRRATGDWVEFEERHQRPVDSLAIDPAGRFIGSGSEDNTVQLWEIATLRRFGQPLQGHQGWVSALAFGPNGKMVAAGSWDRTVRLWDIDGTPMGLPLQGHTDRILHVTFDQASATLVSYGRDQRRGRWAGGGDANTWLSEACTQLAEHGGALEPAVEDVFSSARAACERR